ncbi:MAG: hypothetical protein V4773_18560 [Verrucomicrobiota bacterium]
MRTPILLLATLLLATTPALRAAQPPDPALTQSLQTVTNNTLEAGLRTLYANRVWLAQEMMEKLTPVTRNLGDIIDTEIVAVQPVSKRVTRYYVAIYFTRCPLWLRIERYANKEQAFYLPLRFSTNPDEILPGYVTEFYTQ